MNKFISRPIPIIAVLVCIILSGWIFYLPTKIAKTIKLTLQEQTGRAITMGSSGYSFSPQFGIAIQDVTVAGTASLNEPIVHAETVLIPFSVVQLFTGQATAQTLLVDGADFHVAFDGVGHSNAFEGQSPKPTPPLHLQLSNSSFHYFDERSSDQFNFDHISGLADFSSDGEISSSGSAVVKGQFITFDATLASLERAFGDGSPLDLTVEGVASSFSFSGRIATAKRLNLAGQAEMSSTDAPRLSKWLGAGASGLAEIKNIALNGALDSDGPVILLKDAHLKLGDMTAKGEVSFSNAGERPNITVALGFDHLDFSSLNLQTGEGWSDKPIDFSGLGALDMQFRLSTNSLHYNGLKTGVATVEGALKDRVLTATVKSDDLAGGASQFDVGLDATQLPPKLKLDVSLANVAAKPALAALINQSFLSGALTLDSHLTATGNSQAELISTLSGDATASVEGGTVSGAELSTLAKEPVQGWNGGQTPNLKGQAQFSLTEGVAKLGENQLDAAGVSLHSEGDIDLLRKSLDLQTGPDVKVKIQGPWAKPTLTPQ